MSNDQSARGGLRIVETDKVENGVVVINGLPDVGLVGLLAASHIISSLKLREVGAIESDLLPPMIVLHSLWATPATKEKSQSRNDLPATALSHRSLPGRISRVLVDLSPQTVVVALGH